ncbi:MAG: DUF3891 family protein, partial [Caldilineaceae bacterium]|nr:DUF3891 family protein [Caldilineaceae bacterium]
MITRPQPNGQLLCVNQTSHGLMAAEFCRHWGNADFAAPTPYAPVMAAIAQHDNGWYEWELAPLLRPDGAPMDFLHGPPLPEKLALWQLSVERAAAQHPYAGLLVGRHAGLLYLDDMHRLSGEDLLAVKSFISAQELRIAQAAHAFAEDAILGPALQASVVEAHTRLLQFGDNASLQVSIPWGQTRTLHHCPVDFQGEYTSIEMTWDDEAIYFAPW